MPAPGLVKRNSEKKELRRDKRAHKKREREHNKSARKTEGSRLRMKLFGNKSKTTHKE